MNTHSFENKLTGETSYFTDSSAPLDNYHIAEINRMKSTHESIFYKNSIQIIDSH